MPDDSVPAPPPAAPPSQSKRSWSWWMFAAFAGVGLLGGLVGGAVVKATTGSSGSSTTGSVCQAVKVAKVGLPSMVKVLASKGSASGTGSGELIRDDGYILTNDHVISVALNGGAVSVLYSDGSTSPAEIVGTDQLTDLAVLKAKEGFDKLPPITIGSSADVRVGQPVIALGAPLGLPSTVTAGIVSALDRHVPVPSANGDVAHLVGALQTDASINPGNSGGALVDCKGKLVGVNTAIATVPDANGQAGGGSVGLGFAIPVDMAYPIAQELIADGHASHPSVGLQVEQIPPAAAAAAGLEPGLFVASVTKGGPGDKAGIQQGDVITKVNGDAARRPDQLTVAELESRSGQKITLTYVRGGSTKDVTIATTDSGP